MKKLVLVGALLAPNSLSGQRLASIPHYAVSSLPAPAFSFRFDTAQAIPRTYWLEGGVIGGLGMGVFATMLANGLGEGNTTAAGEAMAFVIGASVGFPVGALIGGQFPKHDQ
ncbi:MAG: hypothetical protein ACM358_03945 [Gemmatimonadota bacterium]